jgi:hypothetical protein
MKIYSVLVVLMVAFLHPPVMAQLVIKKDATGKTVTSLAIPGSRLVSASSRIKLVTVNNHQKIPKMVELDPAGQLTKIKNECPLLKKGKPTLELEGNRITHETANLEWKATNGANNLGFDVERSLEDTFHFERVNYVWAKNIAGLKDIYKLSDDNNYSKLSYYRLRLVLRTGEILYSNIAKVGGYDKDGLLLFPNPASNFVRLSVLANIEGAGQLKIYDAGGKMVWQQSSTWKEGMNTETISLDKLPPGTYTILINRMDQQSRTARFVKQ